MPDPREDFRYYDSPSVQVMTKGFVVTFTPKRAILKANASIPIRTFACGSDRQVKKLFSDWLNDARAAAGE